MVFSNTTPFISLSSVQLLHLLPSIFGEVSVAASVVEECSEGGRIVVPDLTGLPWVRVQAVQSQLHLPALFELDRGERDTLSMNRFVIANKVKQSMTPDCMDCHATLAVTQIKPSLRGTQ